MQIQMIVMDVQKDIKWLVLYIRACYRFTIFTGSNAIAFITLVPKIDAATFQIQPLLIAHKGCTLIF